MATYTSNYAWTKPGGNDQVDISVLNGNLDSQDAIMHKAFTNMAQAFSAASTYAVGDIVLYDNELYKCHTAVVTPGSWTGSTNWDSYTLAEGGGGGGTSDYPDLTNKPQINGVTLTGNKTASDLGLQDELTFDNVPTDGSNNPVKSDGIYDALTLKADKTATATGETLSLVPTSEGKALLHMAYGMSVQDGTPTPSVPVDIESAKADFRSVGKNLISYPYLVDSQTINGVTFTINNDGSVIATGKATGGDAILTLHARQAGETNDLIVPNGSYILSGCPANGSNSKYHLNIGRTKNGVWNTLGVDRGAGVNVECDGDDFSALTVNPAINITIKSGYEIQGSLIFNPMLRLADVTDATYESYTKNDTTTDLTLRAIEVSSTDNYNLVRDNKYYIADTLDYSEDNGFVVTRRIGHIASYDSESITTKWMSSKDVYASGTNPSSGATVDYILTTPTTETITTAQALALLGLKTYDESTTISSQAEPSCMIAVEYAKERLGALALTAYNTAKGNDIRITALEG